MFSQKGLLAPMDPMIGAQWSQARRTWGAWSCISNFTFCSALLCYALLCAPVSQSVPEAAAMATLVRPGPGSPRRPIASSQQDPHPLSRQEKVDAGDVVLVKTVVDYCVLHKLSLNKNFATKTWADISVITRNACEVRGLLDSEAKRQFSEAQCKTLWHKFTQSFRQIHAYINKHTGGGLPFFEQDDETRKQLANLGGKCKNMKQEMYDLMAPVMANDSATAPLCLVSGGVDTGVYKRGRGRVDSSDTLVITHTVHINGVEALVVVKLVTCARWGTHDGDLDAIHGKRHLWQALLYAPTQPHKIRKSYH
ncbi:hypothetical protein QJQ45_029531 [Haematococcus lacustris]|nr:hypothetical protein QJQ45_029531 [Haematococcus lacustris]